jgi:hypothetical protein
VELYAKVFVHAPSYDDVVRAVERVVGVGWHVDDGDVNGRCRCARRRRRPRYPRSARVVAELP